jgi:NADH dehydrogenase [ubiquinone] 1 alpha subcomplex assembly factor 5
MEREGGISPHVSPMAHIRDVSNLLQESNFTLTTIDVDEVIVNYPSMFELLNDLRSMGENNAVTERLATLR